MEIVVIIYIKQDLNWKWLKHMKTEDIWIFINETKMIYIKTYEKNINLTHKVLVSLALWLCFISLHILSVSHCVSSDKS